MPAGEKLHNKYVGHMGNEGIGVDRWSELDEAEQDAWQALAEELGFDDD